MEQSEKVDQEQDDEMNEVLNQLDDKLNLTAGEDDIQDRIDQNIEEECNKFMKNIQNDQSDQLPQFQNAFSQLLQGLGSMNQDGDQKGGENLEQIFQNFQKADNGDDQMDQMFQGMDKNPQFENFANQLLNEFMDKDIIYEPLQDARKSYLKYLEENKQDEQTERYQNQLKVINEIIESLDKQPDNKEYTIKLFEKMQEYGDPPEQLAQQMGANSPFEMFRQEGKQQSEQQQDQDCKMQ